MTERDPIASWPARTREVYVGLQTYRIVGASACLAAIVDGLRVLAEAGATPQQLAEAGAAFCALKPDTASYASIVGWLLRDADAATVTRRADVFARRQHESLGAIRTEGAELVAAAHTVLVHDYSSTVLAVLEQAAQNGTTVAVAVTAGAPLDKGALVAREVSSFGHRVAFYPDAGIARAVESADLILSGVETLFRGGDLANTVGTYPIALVARETRVPFYGVTELVKVHPSAETTALGDLSASLLKPWPAAKDIPDGTRVHTEVLDLTPGRLVTAYVTERGLLAPAEAGTAFDALLAELDGLAT